MVGHTLILPFGLALNSSVSFQIDEKPAMALIRSGACVSDVCLVNVSFDAATIMALRADSAFTIKATADGRATASFSISPQSLGSALDRVATLAR